MHEHLDVLMRCPLFTGHTADEIEAMLNCLCAQKKTFPPRAVIHGAGSEIHTLGILLAGRIDIIQEDFWGNQSMLARLAPGDLFAESFALAGTPKIPVSVIAGDRVAVLLLDYRRILSTCKGACPYHEKLAGNLLFIVAQKNVFLTQKMEIMAKRTIREKLLVFLSFEAQRAGSRSFTISYDRQALADYLAVDRSALSRTLGDMQREGLLTYAHNRFELMAPSGSFR